MATKSECGTCWGYSVTRKIERSYELQIFANLITYIYMTLSLTQICCSLLPLGSAASIQRPNGTAVRTTAQPAFSQAAGRTDTTSKYVDTVSQVNWIWRFNTYRNISLYLHRIPSKLTLERRANQTACKSRWLFLIKQIRAIECPMFVLVKYTTVLSNTAPLFFADWSTWLKNIDYNP